MSEKQTTFFTINYDENLESPNQCKTVHTIYENGGTNCFQ
jgi:hypothetical protein